MQVMGTSDVRIDQKLNKAVWSQGVKFVSLFELLRLNINAFHG